jgi:prepilin-type N-terminal cleavage/methylation domain-containing protein
MNKPSQNSRGFTLVELMLAMALGLLVLGATVTLFKKALDITMILTQRAEMQQNARAAVNSMVRDLSLAATDLPPGGILLPQTLPPLPQPRFGCSQVICYLTNGNNIFAGGELYYVNPHSVDGALIGNVTPDSVVVAYTDPAMVLGPVTFAPAGDLTGSAITVTNPPANIAGQSNSITVGDLIWLSNTNGSAIGVVTTFNGINTLSFAAGDPLNINQPPAQVGGAVAGIVNGDITSNLMNAGSNPPVIPGAAGGVPPLPQITAQRIFLVTYFVTQDPVTGRRLLMRQVNAHLPTPVAENVENLQVTYDTIDNTLTPPVLGINQRNPAGNPNLIRKINIALTIRTTQKVGGYGDYQRLTLATSVSPRNLSTTPVF